MRTKAWLILLLMVIVACHKKDKPAPPPGKPVKDKPELRVKDVTVRNLPNPYYHFEYNAAGFINIASYSSGLGIYEVEYENERISRMINKNEPNQDILEYEYENGRLKTILIKRKSGLLYRKVIVSTNTHGQLEKLEWQVLTANNQFTSENYQQFSYYEDGNLNNLTQHYYAMNGVGESTYTDHFESYDNKPNPEGFSVVHPLQDMHLVLFPSFIIQKNNPGREIRTGDGVNYEVTYNYTPDAAGRPTTRAGVLRFTNGPNPGQPIDLLSTYSYYD